MVSYWPLAETPMTTHPNDFGIQIEDARFEQAADDFPQVRTRVFNRVQISQLIQQLRLDLNDYMKDMIRRRKIPTSRILSWFDLAGHYKVVSSWYALLSEMPAEYGYYEMLHTGEVCESKDISKEAFYDAHPMRVLSLNYHISYSDDNHFDLMNLHLSELEQQVLLYSVGKLSVREIIQWVIKEPEQIEEGTEQVVRALQRLEKNHLVLFSLY